MVRTVEGINAKLAAGDAVVMTADEIAGLVAEGREDEVREVDVVTTGTMGLMSGTFAVLSFPLSRPGEHRRFVRGTINGVPMVVGPCPNEGLGLIDAMVYGTAHREAGRGYGAGHLFRALAEGEEVEVEATTDRGVTVSRGVMLEDMPKAVLMSTRNLFRNYRAIVNPSDEEVHSIFHSLPFPPRMKGLTFSGCGHLSPLQNDPGLRAIGIGTKVLFNGGEGFVIGAGTRSSAVDPNLMTIADLHAMDPSLMGGFLTAAGPECICSYAVPVPVLDDSILSSVMTPDGAIPLPVVDVRDRSKIAVADYGQVWPAGSAGIAVDATECLQCAMCSAVKACPAGAIMRGEDGPAIDGARCFQCGTCVASCEGECFRADLGSVRIERGGEVLEVPVICRQSNRAAASRTADDLKRRILDRSFAITGKVADILP